MAGDTKQRILETALELFAQSGYLGTSMHDIAGQLGITKGALYKHYCSKQEILDCIIARMNQMDYARAEEYEMPETEPDGFAEAYMHTPIAQIHAYSMAQFDHWTQEPFSANFRKMLTLEQYREPKLAQLHHDYLAGIQADHSGYAYSGYHRRISGCLRQNDGPVRRKPGTPE